MSVIEAFLAELEQEAGPTRGILEAVPESLYEWKPHEKGMSMAELCAHIATSPGGMTHGLDGDAFDIAAAPDMAPAATSKAELLATWDASVAACRDWIGGLGDRVNGMWTFKKAGNDLMTLPRAMAIRFFVFNHLIHHRGQLSAYLRAAGATVPPIYGPTADIDPFDTVPQQFA